MRTQYFFLLLVLMLSSQAIYAQNTNWNGSKDSNWADEDNWSNGVPTGSHSVTILGTAANWPELPGPVTLSSLTLNSGSQLDTKGYSVTTSTAGNSFTSATLNNSSSGPITLFINGAGTTAIDNSTFTKAVSITLDGVAELSESNNNNASYQNTYQANAVFTHNGTGTLYIARNRPAAFGADLIVTRTGGGITNLFQAGGSTITENLSYTNLIGGTTIIGSAAAITTIEGKVDIDTDVDEENSNPAITLQRIKNNTAGDGVISIKKPGVVTFTSNDLKASGITISDKTTGNAIIFTSNVLDAALSVSDATNNTGQTQIDNNTFKGTAAFTYTSAAEISESNNTNASYQNTYEASAVFTHNGTGNLWIARSRRAVFGADLTVTRGGAGFTQVFNSGASQITTGNFSYTNLVGGGYDHWRHRCCNYYRRESRYQYRCRRREFKSGHHPPADQEQHGGRRGDIDQKARGRDFHQQ